jgi:tetratricopeptide (TPR) repeat protein
LGKGNCLLCLERYEEALTAYAAAQELDPTQLYVYQNQARAYVRLKRFEQVLAMCEKGLPLAAGNAKSASNLLGYQSQALLSLHRYAEALDAALQGHFAPLLLEGSILGFQFSDPFFERHALHATLHCNPA